MNEPLSSPTLQKLRVNHKMHALRYSRARCSGVPENNPIVVLPRFFRVKNASRYNSDMLKKIWNSRADDPAAVALLHFVNFIIETLTDGTTKIGIVFSIWCTMVQSMIYLFPVFLFLSSYNFSGRVMHFVPMPIDLYRQHLCVCIFVSCTV